MRESDNPLLNISSTIVDMIDGGAIVGTVVGGLILALNQRMKWKVNLFQQ